MEISFKTVMTQMHLGAEFFVGVIHDPTLPVRTHFQVQEEIENKRETTLYDPEDLMSGILIDGNLIKNTPLSHFKIRLKELMVSFRGTRKMARRSMRHIRASWILKQIYELMDDSLDLLFDYSKQLVIICYEQIIDRKSETIVSRSEKIKKYVEKTNDIMEKVLGRIATFFSSRPDLLFLLNDRSKKHFFENSDVSKIGYLQRRRWILEEHLFVAPRYYAFWNNFWKGIIVRYFKLGDDICGKIAEFIPTRIIASTFLEFFRKPTEKFIVHSDFSDLGQYYNNIVVVLK